MNDILQNAKITGLISAHDLHAILNGDGHVRLLDATYPANPHTIKIEGAQVFDIDQIADPESAMPHMLPSAAFFGDKIGELGISNSDFVVVYDQSGIAFAAARAWWMFKTFGHENVAVLNGGLPAWAEARYPLTGSMTDHVKTTFTASFKPEWVCDLSQMRDHVRNKSAVVLDARASLRFQGLAQETGGLRSGHMPGALNLPFASLLEKQFLTDPHIAQEIISQFSLTPDSKLVTTCGSGVTACVLTLALYRAGHKNLSVYDGSWSEWGKQELDTEILNHSNM